MTDQKKNFGENMRKSIDSDKIVENTTIETENGNFKNS